MTVDRCAGSGVLVGRGPDEAERYERDGWDCSCGEHVPVVVIGWGHEVRIVEHHRPQAVAS